MHVFSVCEAINLVALFENKTKKNPLQRSVSSHQQPPTLSELKVKCFKKLLKLNFVMIALAMMVL